MKKIVRPMADAIAILVIATSRLSTALTDLFGSESAAVSVKTALRSKGFRICMADFTSSGRLFTF